MIPGGGTRSRLSTLRLTFAAFAVTSLLVGLVLIVIPAPSERKSATAFAALVAIIGLAGVTLSWRSRSRPLARINASALAASYAAQLFVGIAFAQLPAMMGFVGPFISGSDWVYVMGLAFSLLGYALVAPTDGAIRRGDEQLVAAGSPYLLSEALRQPPSLSSPSG